MNLRIVKRTIDKVTDYIVEYGLPSGYKSEMLWKEMRVCATLEEAELQIKSTLNPPEVKREVIWETKTGEILPSEKDAIIRQEVIAKL